MADKLVASRGEFESASKRAGIEIATQNHNVVVDGDGGGNSSICVIDDSINASAGPDSNSVLFWKFISNLPKSISQRRRSVTSDALTPEVAGYLARMQQEKQQLRQLSSINTHQPEQRALDLTSNKCPKQTQPSCSSSSNENDKTIIAIQESSKQVGVTPLGAPRRASGQSVRVCQQQDGQSIVKIQQATTSKSSLKSKTITTTTAAATTKTTTAVASMANEDNDVKLTMASTGHNPTRRATKANRNKLAHLSTSTSQDSTSSPSSSASSNSSLTRSLHNPGSKQGSSVGSLSSCVIGADSNSETSSVSNEVRLRWSKKMDFLLSIIGFAVDLANIWRFPYLVYKNGGGVFLIPYVIMLIFGGIPLFFLELCLGQFVKKGPITVWNKICPAMKGVGYCSILISWYVSFYYNVLIGWSVYFIYRSFVSFGDKMPWEDCDNQWNSGLASAFYNFTRSTQNYNQSYLDWANMPRNATTTFLQQSTSALMSLDHSDLINNDGQSTSLGLIAAVANTTCVSISQLKAMCSHRNETLEVCKNAIFQNVSITSPATEFFVKELSQIDQSTGLDDMGYLRIELVLCTLIVYLLHYFSLFRGLETSGKVVWVTATAPYMILSVLLVRGLFLPGATRGIQYYLSPRLEKLADPQVWTDAAVQVFYSIGVGFGVHLTYASFNNHNNNCHRDCLMTSAVNVITSVYSGLVVFVYIGYMAQNLGVEIDEVASEGYSLVFEVYPEALTTLPFARFWSILFFIMLLTLGIDSAMGGLEAVITGIEDEFKFAKNMHRGLLTGLVIASSFLFALISCTQGGAYTLFWFDIYSASVSLLFSALFEAIGVVYFYGLDKFILDIESMLGRKPHMFYIICWKYISPLFLGGVIFTSLYTAIVPTYRNYKFPYWSVVLGWCLTFSSVIAVPIFAIVHYVKQRNNTKRRSRSGGAASSAASSRHQAGGGGNSGKKTPGSQHHHHHHHHHRHQNDQQHKQNELDNLQDKSNSTEMGKLAGGSGGMITAVLAGGSGGMITAV